MIRRLVKGSPDIGMINSHGCLNRLTGPGEEKGAISVVR